MEAAGPAEAWDVIEIPGEIGGFAFKTLWNTYLAIEHDGSLRADSTEIHSAQTFYIKCQGFNSLYLAHNRQTTKKKEVTLASKTEIEQLKSRYSFGGKLEQFLSDDYEGIEKAKKLGKLNEELVNRRSKIKNDRYCK
jgi:protein FRG1